ncbi:MAG: BlaI/MecI/CopY family transcriptional regulator, partial [Planctomycetota bacterium]
RNLERKGFLSHEIEGRTHVYLAKVDERTAAQSAVKRILDQLFEGSPVRLANALFEEEQLSKAEFEKIRQSILALRLKEVGDDPSHS